MAEDDDHNEEKPSGEGSESEPDHPSNSDPGLPEDEEHSMSEEGETPTPRDSPAPGQPTSDESTATQQPAAATGPSYQSDQDSTRRQVVVGGLLLSVLGIPFVRSYWGEEDELLDSVPTGGVDSAQDLIPFGDEEEASGPPEYEDNDSEEEDLFDEDEDAGDSDGIGNDDGSTDEEVTFLSCTEAEITGEFEEEEFIYASTWFHDEVGSETTLLEDGITFGDNVDAPFTGTVRFEIDDDGSVTESADEIVVPVPDYGEYGTIIMGFTTTQEDYANTVLTHSNPEAEECIEEIETRADEDTQEEPDDNDGEENQDEEESDSFEDDDSEDVEPARFEVTTIETNSPVGPQEMLYVDTTIENTGAVEGTTTVELIVGVDPTVEDRRTILLDPGESADLRLSFRAGDPTGGREEFPVEVATSDASDSEMVVVEE